MPSKPSDLEMRLERALQEDSDNSDANSGVSQDEEKPNFKPVKGDAISAEVTVLSGPSGDSGYTKITWVRVDEDKTVVPTLFVESVYAEIPPAKVVERLCADLRKEGKPHDYETLLSREDFAVTPTEKIKLFPTKKIYSYLTSSINRKLKKAEKPAKREHDGEAASQGKKRAVEPPIVHPSGGVKPCDDESEDEDIKADPEAHGPELTREESSKGITLKLFLPMAWISPEA